MASDIYLLMLREGAIKYEMKLTSSMIPLIIGALAKDMLWGDSLDIPFMKFIRVETLGHHIGYFKNDDGQHLVYDNAGNHDVRLEQPNEFAAGRKPDYAPQLRRHAETRQPYANIRQRADTWVNDANNEIDRLQGLIDPENVIIAREQTDLDRRWRLEHRRRAQAPLSPPRYVQPSHAQTQAERARSPLVSQQRIMRAKKWFLRWPTQAASTLLEFPGYLTAMYFGGVSMGQANQLPIHGDFHFTKKTDKASAQLAFGCSAQEKFPMAVFVVRRRTGLGVGDIRMPYLVIGLKDVMIRKWEMDGIDQETVALSYNQISHCALDEFADTNMAVGFSNRWFNRPDLKGGEGGLSLIFQALVQGIVAGSGALVKKFG